MAPPSRIPTGNFRDPIRSPISQTNLLVLGLRLATSVLALPRKPILTLVLIGSMSLIYLRPDLLGPELPHDENWNWYEREQSYLRTVCLMPADILEAYWRYGTLNLWRLFFSALVHANEVHLFYNMISFLIKGYSLEFMMGQRAFGSLVVFCLLVSQILLLFSSWALMALFDIDLPINSCVVGFSGVIFALKYVLARHSPNWVNTFGFELPTLHATWLELILISVVVPNASFLGHLCGILTGVIHVELPILFPTLCLLPSARRSYTYSSGTLGGGRTSGTRAGGRKSSTPPSASLVEQEGANVQEAVRRSLADTGGGDCSRRSCQGVPAAGDGALGEGEPRIVVGCPVQPSAPSEEHPLLDGDRTGERSIPSSVTL